MPRWKWIALATAGLLGSLLIGVSIGASIAERPDGRFGLLAATGTEQVLGIGQVPPAYLDAQDVDFKQFWELWRLIKDKYYQQPVKDKELFYGAMAGLAASLGDPYTSYFEPQAAVEFQQSLEGKFEGIGAEIGIKDDQLQIVAPLPDTPAERAGLLPGDAIIKIDTTETTGMSVEKAVTLIRGPKGTIVKLTIYRASTKKPPFDVSITREQIQIKSVRSKMLEKDLAYLEVTHFNGDTSAGFDQAVTSLLKKNPKGVILDLRNNPGGFLETSLEMAGEWVGDKPVVKERRQGQIVETLAGGGRNRLSGIPTVVLVNEGSASASEIVAGALHDYGMATIVGKKTFGKGSVQDYQNFKDGSGIKITIAEWVTPKERAIHQVGLEPDVTIERTPEDYENQRDPQLDRAIAILTGTATSTAAATGEAGASSTRR